MKSVMIPMWSKWVKINIPAKSEEKDEVNIKESTLLADIKEYKEMDIFKVKDIFKEDLMSNIW